MKQFETFGEYMFDLLFAPLKKGRKTVNQLCIFFKVMGREFDDLKAAIFRVRSEANVASCSEVMLPVHGQDRDMPRLEGEDAEAYRTRLSMEGDHLTVERHAARRSLRADRARLRPQPGLNCSPIRMRSAGLSSSSS